MNSIPPPQTAGEDGYKRPSSGAKYGPSAGVLGPNTKSAPPQHRETRRKRYEIQRAAAFLARSEAENLGKLPYDLHRVSKCWHCRIADTVDVVGSRFEGQVYLSGVMLCGSVWACPACSAKIARKRELEIRKVIIAAYDAGYTCSMITLTFPHKKGMILDDLIVLQQAAIKYFRKGGAYTKYLKEIDYQGNVRTHESTHGLNGWHPHTHEVWVHKITANRKTMENRVKRKWIDSLEKAGLDMSNKAAIEKHAVDFQWSVSSSEYLAKTASISDWGIEAELARSSTKIGKSHGRSQFRILADFAETGKKSDARLFLEFIQVMSSRRVRSIFISPKLRKLANLGAAQTDLDLASQDDVPEQEKEVFLRMPDWDWQIVKDHRFVTGIMDMIEDRGVATAKKWLADRGGRLIEISYEASQDTKYIPLNDEFQARYGSKFYFGMSTVNRKS